MFSSHNPFGDLMKEFEQMVKDHEPKPDDPRSQSPCSKCRGLEFGCSISGKRIPIEECGAFFQVGKKIVVEYKDGTKRER